MTFPYEHLNAHPGSHSPSLRTQVCVFQRAKYLSFVVNMKKSSVPKKNAPNTVKQTRKSASFVTKGESHLRSVSNATPTKEPSLRLNEGSDFVNDVNPTKRI